MSKEQYLPFFMDMPLYLVKDKEASDNVEEKPETTSETLNPQVEESLAGYEAQAIPTEGQNLKACVILLANDLEFASQRDFLFKVLASVKRNQEDVLLANCADVNIDQLEALLSEHNHRHLLSFGVELPPSRAVKEKYRVQAIKHVQVLSSDSLAAIQEDMEKKKALWKALQSMFLA